MRCFYRSSRYSINKIDHTIIVQLSTNLCDDLVSTELQNIKGCPRMRATLEVTTPKDAIYPPLFFLDLPFF